MSLANFLLPNDITTVRNHLCGVVVKLVITPACHAGGRGFKSRPSRHFLYKTLLDSVAVGFFVLVVGSGVVRHSMQLPQNSSNGNSGSGDDLCMSPLMLQKADFVCPELNRIKLTKKSRFMLKNFMMSALAVCLLSSHAFAGSASAGNPGVGNPANRRTPWPGSNGAANSCTYQDAYKNNGWGWNPYTRTACPPRCNYQDAYKNNGWGWDSASGASCAPQ